MEIPDYRRIALQCHEAFRGVAKDCCTTFLDGCDEGMSLSYLDFCCGILRIMKRNVRT